MKQRLGIAVALAGDPDFLVLDEPVNGLDLQGIVEIRELILKLNQKRQITVLISSHILDKLGIEYKILNDRQADIYAKPNISELTLTLAKEGCKVLSI